MSDTHRPLWGMFLAVAGVGISLLTAYEVWSHHRTPAGHATDAPQAVRQLLEGQQAAWNRGDLDGYMAGYWQSMHLSFFTSDEPRHGWQATRDRYRARYQGDGRTMGQLDFSDLSVELLAPDCALARGRWHVAAAGKGSSGLFTLIVRKLPEGWRIVHDHTSAGDADAKRKGADAP